MSSEVHEPPHVTRHLPGVDGAIGPEPQDFRVDEVPAYLPNGEGEHLYVRLEKQRLSTPDLVRRVAEAAGVDGRDVGYAGLKDKHAVTTQWLSLPARAQNPEAWQLPEGVRLIEHSRHANKLRTGHLSGNRFRIALVGVCDDALSRAKVLQEYLSQHGFSNYFGAQRFGFDNLQKALAWLEGGGRARLSPFLLKLYPSVVQSEIFNRYLTLRREVGLDQLFAGEVVRLEGSSASFVVEDLEREKPRLAARDIHLTGPMLGPKMRAASGAVLELEERARKDLGVTDAMLSVIGKFAPGTRRDLVVVPSELTVEAEGPSRLVLSFGLPAGSYATVLVRELTRSPLSNAPDASGREA